MYVYQVRLTYGIAYDVESEYKSCIYKRKEDAERLLSFLWQGRNPEVRFLRLLAESQRIVEGHATSYDYASNPSIYELEVQEAIPDDVYMVFRDHQEEGRSSDDSVRSRVSCQLKKGMIVSAPQDLRYRKTMFEPAPPIERDEGSSVDVYLAEVMDPGTFGFVTLSFLDASYQRIEARKHQFSCAAENLTIISDEELAILKAR